MTVEQLEEKLISGEIRWFNIDDIETDKDYISGSFCYNIINKCFEFGMSIYHASEDNNANNPEAHTDEEDFFGNSINEIVDEITEECFSWFREVFEKCLEGR